MTSVFKEKKEIITHFKITSPLKDQQSELMLTSEGWENMFLPHRCRQR